VTTDGGLVRVATTDDLPLLEAVEDAGDRLFPTLFPEWELGASPTGAERADEPGWLLVTGRPPVGFAHAVRLAGEAFLEQVSVLPEQGRRGLGGALVDEVCRVVAADGYPRLWLRTYADIPWNAPFYARHGFGQVPLADEPPWMTPLRENEERFGLHRHGQRVAMVRPLRA
jgi:GNAT superfamily N-acetyltransferase